MSADEPTYTIVLTAEQRHALHEALKDTVEESEEIWREEPIEDNEHLRDYAAKLRPVLSLVATAEPDEEGDGCCEHCPVHGGF